MKKVLDNPLWGPGKVPFEFLGKNLWGNMSMNSRKSPSKILSVRIHRVLDFAGIHGNAKRFSFERSFERKQEYG